MLVVHVKFWDVKMTRDCPTSMFIFGDNTLNRGKGGQAIIRDEPNAFGIPTKKAPSCNSGAYFNDQEFSANARAIDMAIRRIEEAATRYDTLVLPTDGLGTGLADLPRRAPRTYAYLNKQLKSFVDRIQIKHSQ